MKKLIYILLVLFVGCGTSNPEYFGIAKTEVQRPQMISQTKYSIIYMVYVTSNVESIKVYYEAKDGSGDWQQLDYATAYNVPKSSSKVVGVGDSLVITTERLQRITATSVAYSKELGELGAGVSKRRTDTLDLKKIFNEAKTWAVDSEVRKLQTLQKRKVLIK